MKGILKFFPAALSVFALASCSENDMLGEKFATQQGQDLGDLIVTVDPLDNESVVTRSYRTGDWQDELPDGSKISTPQYYADGDILKIYDDELYKYDVYEYNKDGQGAAFFKKYDEILTKPTYALFPGDKVNRGYYDRETGITKAEFAIPHVLEYNAASEKFVAESPEKIVGYAYNLPQFGTASKLADGKMGARLRHLTAILKLKLDNVFSNASWLRITNAAKKPMSGTFVAEFDVYNADGSLNEDKFKAVKLDPEKNLSDLITYPEIYIDLRNVPSGNSVIYIPILEGLTEADNIKLEFTAYTGKQGDDGFKALLEQGATGWSTATNEQKWGDTGMEFPGINFEHNKIYMGSDTFSFDDMTPNKVSQLLNQYKESTSGINIELTKKFTIRADVSPEGQRIKLPKFTNNVPVTITLGENFATWDNTPNARLYIEDADPSNPFTGTITLDVNSKMPTSSNTGLEINLKSGNATLIGNLNGNSNKLQLTSGNIITIGDGTTETKLTANNALQTLGDDVKKLVIKDKAEVTADIVAGKNTAAIEVDGDITGAITGNTDAEAVANTITIGENGSVSAGIDAKDANTAVTISGEITANGVKVGKANTAVTVNATGSIKAGGITSTSEVANTITIAGPVTGDVTSDPTTSTQYAGWKTDVKVSGIGRVDGNIGLNKNLLGKLTIDAVPTDNGTSDKIVSGNVTTGGFVEVYLKAATEGSYKSGEGVAIGGTLTMTGATKEVKLIQGYIFELKAAVNNGGSWENKYIALTLNDAHEGIAAIKKLTEENSFVKYTESLWDGKVPTNATYQFSTTSAPAEPKKSLYAAANATNLITASQIAWMQDNDCTASTLFLINDINMNTKDFKGIQNQTTLTTFHGNSHKIKNLKLFNKETLGSPAVDYALSTGLFVEVNTNALSVDNLALENVEHQTALTAKGGASFTNNSGKVIGVGALVGSAEKKITANKVSATFKNQFFGSEATNKLFVNVGGLIGCASAGVDIKSCTVTGAKLAGFNALGGLVGRLSGTDANTIDACTTAVTFDQKFVNDNTMDCWYASIGGFVGLATGGAPIAITGTNSVSPINDRTDTSLTNWNKKYVSSTSTSDGKFYDFTRNQNYLGFSGRASGDANYGYGTVTIGGTSYTVPTTVPATSTNNVLYYFNHQHGTSY